MLGLSLGLVAGAAMSGHIHGLQFGFIHGSQDYLHEERREGRERLVDMYDAVYLGEDIADVARKVLGHVDGWEIDVSYDNDDGNVSLRVTFSEAYFRDDVLDNWVLTLCFADEQLEGVYFGTIGAVDVPPDAAPSPKGECAPTRVVTSYEEVRN